MQTLKESKNQNLWLEKKYSGTAESGRDSLPHQQQKNLFHFTVNLWSKTQQPEHAEILINYYKVQMFSYMPCLIFTFFHTMSLTVLPGFPAQIRPSSTSLKPSSSLKSPLITPNYLFPSLNSSDIKNLILCKKCIINESLIFFRWYKNKFYQLYFLIESVF